MWRKTQARPREHVSASKVAIDSSTLLQLTQACSYVLLGSQVSLLPERVFKEFFSRVSEAIQGCLDKFVGELLSKDLIDWEVAKDVSEVGLSSTKKSHNLLFAVRSKIASAKSDKPLRRLCRVMEKFSVLKVLAKEMMERFGKCLPC